MEYFNQVNLYRLFDGDNPFYGYFDNLYNRIKPRTNINNGKILIISNPHDLDFEEKVLNKYLKF